MPEPAGEGRRGYPPAPFLFARKSSETMRLSPTFSFRTGLFAFRMTVFDVGRYVRTTQPRFSIDFLCYWRWPGGRQQRTPFKISDLSIFCDFVIMSVDGLKCWAYNAAHRTRAAALLAADELALGFPEEAGENLA